MSIHERTQIWLDSSATILVDGAAGVAQRFSQRYFRGPQILLFALESGVLDLALSRLDAEVDDVLEWLTPLAESSTSRWATAPDPAIDPGTASSLVTLGRSLERALGATDVIQAILGSGLGMRMHESRGSPVSLDDLYLELERDARDEEDGARDRRSTGAGEDGVTAAAGRGTAAPPAGFEDVLRRFARNLSDQAEGASRFGATRKQEIDRIAGILCRLKRPNPLIIGQSGVGKTALVDGLAAAIHAGETPEWLRGIEIFAVSCGSLLAGASYRGQLEERVQQLIDVAIVRKDIVLFFDDIHALADSGATGSSNLLGLFHQHLEKRSFRMIAAAPTSGFEAHIRPNAAFVRHFEVVSLGEPDSQLTVQMLKEHLPQFRKHYGLDAKDEVLDAIVGNCERFIHSRYFPDKAISLLDSAMQRARQSGAEEVPIGCVLEVVSEETGIPVGQLGEMEQAKLRGLQTYLDERVFDQKRATGAMSRAVQSMRLGLQDPNRTGASFLFVGPPGTGKTELAKAVSQYLMGSVNALARFNMSEFQTPESYQRLIGPPPGYVGYDAGGELTNRLLENPYSVVLFDEIEKGSSRVFDVFLQVLSDGHLTDNHGRVVDCKNSVFVMTSNALADVARSSDSEIREMLLHYSDPHKGHQLGPTFRREFIDRLEVIAFDSLSENTLRKILRREVGRVISQVNSSAVVECHVDVEKGAMDWLIERIDCEATGARSVQRMVESSVSRLISDCFIEGRFSDHGAYRIAVEAEGLAIHAVE